MDLALELERHGSDSVDIVVGMGMEIGLDDLIWRPGAPTRMDPRISAGATAEVA